MELLLMFVGTALLILGLAIPLALGNVPPNALYGVRVRATRRNPDVWYYVNGRSGRDLIVVGLVNIVAPIGFYYVADWPESTFVFLCMATLFLSLAVMSIRALGYTRTAVARFGNSKEQ